MPPEVHEDARSILSQLEKLLDGRSSPWLSKKQAAQYLGCHANYLARLERDGRLRAYVLNQGKGRKSGTKRYRRRDLDRCLLPL